MNEITVTNNSNMVKPVSNFTITISEFIKNNPKYVTIIILSIPATFLISKAIDKYDNISYKDINMSIKNNT